MRLTVRVYKRYDLDLLYLYSLNNENFDFRKEMKNAIISHVRHQSINKTLPTGDCKAIINLPTFVAFHIVFDDTTEKDVVDWLRSITAGRKNTLVKNVFRNVFPVVDTPYMFSSENNRSSI